MIPPFLRAALLPKVFFGVENQRFTRRRRAILSRGRKGRTSIDFLYVPMPPNQTQALSSKVEAALGRNADGSWPLPFLPLAFIPSHQKRKPPSNSPNDHFHTKLQQQAKRERLESPTHKPPDPIKPASQLPIRLNHLPLQHSLLNNPLAVLRPHPREPDTLTALTQPFSFLPPRSIPAIFPRISSSSLVQRPVSVLQYLFRGRGIRGRDSTSIHHHISTVFMPPNMANEINTHAAGALVVQISIQTQRAQVPAEFAEEQRRGLAATGVAGALAAEQD